MAENPLAPAAKWPYNRARIVALIRRPREDGRMSSPDPVTHWISQLKAGDRAAVQPLWEHYFRRMVRLARQRLRAAARRVADEEDVALSAFASFCRGAAQGRFPQLTDRDSLWSHLFYYTIRKASHLIRSECRQKRGGGKVQDEASLPGPDADSSPVPLLSREPTPEFAALIAEEYQLLLERLPDARLRSVAQWKLEGYTNDEIAVRLGCVRRSVERMLQLIRRIWS
jgi:DNA-directed RNA polymerase specialized sigma24 family protein